MPRHLISDAHEWINEILTVPACDLVKPQARERACGSHRGKKTLLSLTLVWRAVALMGCSLGGSVSGPEKPLPVRCRCLRGSCVVGRRGRGRRQMGSLAGAAHP
jgi:hypothetical protein